MKQAPKSMRRTRRLRKAGRRLPSVFRTGVLPVAAYGCDNTGMDDTDVFRIRRMASVATPPFAKKPSTTLKLRIYDGPAYHINSAVHRVFKCELAKLGEKPSWAETRGLAGVVICTSPASNGNRSAHPES